MVSSHTSSPAECTVVTRSKTRPLGCGAQVGRAGGDLRAVSLGAIGRCWVIEFARCTVPIAGNGNDASVMIAMCSGKASMCG